VKPLCSPGIAKSAAWFGAEWIKILLYENAVGDKSSGLHFLIEEGALGLAKAGHGAAGCSKWIRAGSTEAEVGPPKGHS
jgi:hypothetical protein